MSTTPPSSSSPQDPMNAVQYHDMGDNNWDPAGVQAQITLLLEAVGPGKPLSPGMTECVLGLMGTFGMQNIGLDADITANLNANSSTISDLSTQLDAAAQDASGVTPGSSMSTATTNFLQDIHTLEQALKTDPFWTKGQGAPMVSQIEAQLEILKNEACTPGGLEELWNQNNSAGTPSGLASTGTAGINAINQSILSTTNMYTGVSKSVQATMQADTAMESTENDTLTNFMKKMFSFIEVMNNNMSRG